MDTIRIKPVVCSQLNRTPCRGCRGHHYPHGHDMVYFMRRLCTCFSLTWKHFPLPFTRLWAFHSSRLSPNALTISHRFHCCFLSQRHFFPLKTWSHLIVELVLIECSLSLWFINMVGASERQGRRYFSHAPGMLHLSAWILSARSTNTAPLALGGKAEKTAFLAPSEA